MYPVTLTDAVISPSGELLEDRITTLESGGVGVNKGYFPTLASLQAAYPVAAIGSIAYVGNSYPYAIYRWDGELQSWVDTGSTGGGESIDLGNYYTKEETHAAIEEEYMVLTQEAYDALLVKEDKFYYCYEEE